MNRNLQPAQFYHGTVANHSEYIPGHLGAKDPGHNFFTNNLYQAHTWANRSARNHGGGEPKVYPVEPIHDYGDDPRSIDGFRTQGALHVTGPAIPTPKSSDLSEMAKSYSPRPAPHNDHYIGRDADYAQDLNWK